MVSPEKAFIVRTHADGTDNLAALNAELNRGWTVKHVTPMGGTGENRQEKSRGPMLAALVILERREPRTGATALAEEIEEEPEEMVEGNGADPELPDPPAT